MVIYEDSGPFPSSTGLDFLFDTQFLLRIAFGLRDSDLLGETTTNSSQVPSDKPEDST